MLLYCFLYFIIGINTTTVNNNFLVTAYLRYFIIESYVILYCKLYKYVIILTNLTYYIYTCIRTIFYILWWKRFFKDYYTEGICYELESLLLFSLPAYVYVEVIQTHYKQRIAPHCTHIIEFLPRRWSKLKKKTQCQ